MTLPFKAVLFDLDGTLIDSVGDIADALNVSLEPAKVASFADEDVARMVGAGARTLVERAFEARNLETAKEHVDAIYAKFLDAYDEEPCRRTQPYPGAVAALEQLKAKGVALGVVTNKPHDLTETILTRLGLRQMFQTVIGASDRLALKPAPDMILAACKELSVQPDETVYVGDSAADVGAARAANVPVIILTHGYTTGPADELGADVAIPAFADLFVAMQQVAGQR